MQSDRYLWKREIYHMLCTPKHAWWDDAAYLTGSKSASTGIRHNPLALIQRGIFVWKEEQLGEHLDPDAYKQTIWLGTLQSLITPLQKLSFPLSVLVKSLSLPLFRSIGAFLWLYTIYLSLALRFCLEIWYSSSQEHSTPSHMNRCWCWQ